ncbi:hypothetical protein DV737_g5804, partial [Chaetothyriales sp. CBS 132003]
MDYTRILAGLAAAVKFLRAAEKILAATANFTGLTADFLDGVCGVINGSTTSLQSIGVGNAFQPTPPLQQGPIPGNQHQGPISGN